MWYDTAVMIMFGTEVSAYELHNII